MKKYLVTLWYRSLIREIEVERETESSVWIKGRRLAKFSNYEKYFSTWEDAHTFLLFEANKRKDLAERNLNDANRTIEKVLAMEKP